MISNPGISVLQQSLEARASCSQVKSGYLGTEGAEMAALPRKAPFLSCRAQPAVQGLAATAVAARTAMAGTAERWGGAAGGGAGELAG